MHNYAKYEPIKLILSSCNGEGKTEQEIIFILTRSKLSMLAEFIKALQRIWLNMTLKSAN